MPPRKYYEVRDPDRMRELIVGRGYTYARVARYAELGSRQFAHALATGKDRRCSARSAKLLAELLEVDVDELFVRDVSSVKGQKKDTQGTGAAA